MELSREIRKSIESALKYYLPKDNSILSRSIRYSVLAPGKRIRPVLVIAAANACGCSYKKVLPAACAIEFIHAFSLIHDDLPAMDDDDLRRGRPTNHKKFGEATAILAGDALTFLAVETLIKGLKGKVSDKVIVEAVNELCFASGSYGMTGGQSVDILSENKKINIKTLNNIHGKKTGALISAAVRIGAIIAGANAKKLKDLTNYAGNLGLAFQIKDDILDVKGSTKKLGKNAGSDVKKSKATFPSLIGIKRSEMLLDIHKSKALASLDSFGQEADDLREIVVFAAEREN